MTETPKLNGTAVESFDAAETTWSAVNTRACFTAASLADNAQQALEAGREDLLVQTEQIARHCFGLDGDPENSGYERVIDFCIGHLITESVEGGSNG